MDLKKVLRQLLMDRDLSVIELSRKSGVPAKTLYHWMSGQKPRNIEQIFKVSSALGVSVEQLFGKKPDEPSREPKRNFDLLGELQAGRFELVLRPIKRSEG